MSRRTVLGQRASFWTTAAVVAHTIWTSAAPALSYPLYASEWKLTTFDTTAIFAVYPVFVVLTLVLFGNLSDYIGRRETMLLGLSASILGTASFAVAPDVSWIFLGRVLMGVGVGLSAGPSAAAVIEYSDPKHIARAGGVTAAAQAVGMMAAALVGGALVQYAPLPTRLNFVVLLVVLGVIFVAAWHLPRNGTARPTDRWRPRMVAIPKGTLLSFVAATASVTTSYVLGAMTLSLGAQIAHDVIASSNALVNGSTIALFALSLGLVTFPAKRLSPSRTILAGIIGAVLSAMMLAASAALHTLSLYILAEILSGAAYSLLLLGGLSLITQATPQRHRAATLSALFLVAYLAQAVVALMLGRVATLVGLANAVDLGVAVVTMLVLGTAVALFLFEKLRRSAPHDRLV